MELIKTGSNGGLLDVSQACEYLNIKKSTLYQMSMRKTVPVVKVGRLVRFRRQDLDAFIERNLQEANDPNNHV